MDRTGLREKINSIITKSSIHFEKGDEEYQYGAVKQILALFDEVRKDERERTIDAVNDYTNDKISFERLSEIMDINYYELAAMCHKRFALKGNSEVKDE